MFLYSIVISSEVEKSPRSISSMEKAFFFAPKKNAPILCRLTAPLPEEGGYSTTVRAELSFRAERSGALKSPCTMLPSPNDSTEKYVT